MKNLHEIIGWYGTLAIVLAYALNSFGFISSVSIYYLLLNLTGSAAIVYISLYKKAFQPAVLNIIWGVIAILVIVKTFILL